MKKALLISILAIALIILAGSTFRVPFAFGLPDPKGHIFSADENGNNKDDFLPTEDVYVYGSGLWGNVEYKIVIIEDTTLHTEDPIPSSVIPPILVTTKPNGKLELTRIWSEPNPGRYDIIADCQDKGNVGFFDYHDDGEDTIETSDKYGFFVVDEVPFGTIVILLIPFGFLGIYAIKRKRNIPIDPHV